MGSSPNCPYGQDIAGICMGWSRGHGQAPPWCAGHTALPSSPQLPVDLWPAGTCTTVNSIIKSTCCYYSAGLTFTIDCCPRKSEQNVSYLSSLYQNNVLRLIFDFFKGKHWKQDSTPMGGGNRIICILPYLFTRKIQQISSSLNWLLYPLGQWFTNDSFEKTSSDAEPSLVMLYFSGWVENFPEKVLPQLLSKLSHLFEASLGSYLPSKTLPTSNLITNENRQRSPVTWEKVNLWQVTW